MYRTCRKAKDGKFLGHTELNIKCNFRAGFVEITLSRVLRVDQKGDN